MNGDWRKSDEEKATLFAETLADRLSDNEITSDVDLNATISSSEPIKLFTPREVADQLDKMNLKKAPGIDEVTIPILRELPKKRYCITYLLTQCGPSSMLPPR